MGPFFETQCRVGIHIQTADPDHIFIGRHTRSLTALVLSGFISKVISNVCLRVRGTVQIDRAIQEHGPHQ